MVTQSIKKKKKKIHFLATKNVQSSFLDALLHHPGKVRTQFRCHLDDIGLSMGTSQDKLDLDFFLPSRVSCDFDRSYSFPRFGS